MDNMEIAKGEIQMDKFGPQGKLASLLLQFVPDLRSEQADQIVEAIQTMIDAACDDTADRCQGRGQWDPDY